MASTFIVSAPGKAILFGEHAAVYHKPVLAAAISLRSYLHVNILEEPQRIVRLKFKDIGLDHTWEIDALPWKKQVHHSMTSSLNPELREAIRPYAESISSDLPETQRRTHIRSATAFLYLFLSIGTPESGGFEYTLRSAIPTGAGLGSSASVCVCLSAALLYQMGNIALPSFDRTSEQAEMQLECINTWAFMGELCMHGDPSGVDNTISTRGNAALYRRNQSGPPTIDPITSFPNLSLLLINTRVAHSTAEQVAKLKRLKDEHPSITEPILTAMGETATAALDLIKTPDFAVGSSGALEQLGTLICTNHGLLNSLSLSHPLIEQICKLVDCAGIGWTKLTGAGGGGCAITLLRTSFMDSDVKGLQQRVTEEGFQVYEAIIGGHGVGILYPTVFNGEGGPKINQDIFENAESVASTKGLIGVGMEESNKGWQFWTRAVA